jgi:hypothetical protein
MRKKLERRGLHSALEKAQLDFRVPSLPQKRERDRRDDRDHSVPSQDPPGGRSSKRPQDQAHQ